MANFIKNRDFGEVMSDTFNFFIKDFKVLVKVLLVFIGPFIAINTYLAFKHQASLELWTENFIKTQDYSGFPFQYFYLLLIGIFQNILLVTTVSAYIKLRINKEKNNIELSEIWKIVSASIFNVTLGQILIFTAIFIGSFIIALSGSISLSLLLIIIWISYVMVSTYLLTFIIVFEKKNVFEAFSRTLFVIKKKRWFIFGIVIVFALILGVSNLLVAIIIEKIALMVSAGTVASIIAALLTSLISVALSAIFTILPAYLYASFVSEKENPDLLEKISQINSDLTENN
ncbi:MAG: hypothetical protein L3J35_06235 [Bacteroidales bacterium]|nr:hypothetical protein [Bacteroidales bacterium]